MELESALGLALGLWLVLALTRVSVPLLVLA